MKEKRHNRDNPPGPAEETGAGADCRWLLPRLTGFESSTPRKASCSYLWSGLPAASTKHKEFLIETLHMLGHRWEESRGRQHNRASAPLLHVRGDLPLKTVYEKTNSLSATSSQPVISSVVPRLSGMSRHQRTMWTYISTADKTISRCMKLFWFELYITLLFYKYSFAPFLECM